MQELNQMKKETFLTAVVAFLLLTGSGSPSAEADDLGLILPMPGQKQMNKASESANVKPAQPARPTTGGKKPQGSEVIISLPATIKPAPASPQNDSSSVTATDTAALEEKPLIKIEPAKPVEVPTSDSNFPTPPDEITISSGAELDDLLPPPPPPEVPVSGDGASGQTLPIFPKDTSSAIFMVMKSWQAENYDGATLLQHAIEVYGQEADEAFKIQGLDSSESFNISIEEEDITLDELLDIIAMKSGRDWGVDIPSRIIYFYPKGVKTDNYNVW